MQALNLPKTELKLTKKGEKWYVFDLLRHRFVLLSPEEWVRQHFIHFLIEHKGYPAARIGNEITLNLNGTRKRCDSVLYGEHAEPRMIMEYKAPHIDITPRVFEQISRYNIALRVEYLIVSNGLTHYCAKIDYEKREYHFLSDIPLFDEL